MFKAVKGNKGVTLVELLVGIAILALIMIEVGNIITNSARFYRNGYFEVQLQSEAQQVIQQLEELMIDANVSISSQNVPAMGSDILTISNNDAKYVIAMTKDDPADPFGKLVYSKESATETVTDIPLADYVESISFNMANYSSDRITVSVKMRNNQSAYASSKDIYLRNEIGSGHGGHNTNNAGKYDIDLDVLRYHKYKLKDYNDTVAYDYVWQDGEPAEYSIDAQYVLSVKASFCEGGNLDKELGPYYIDAKDPATGDTAFVIQVSSEKVQFGINGKGFIYGDCNTSYTNSSYNDIKGISVMNGDFNQMEVYVRTTGYNGTTAVAQVGPWFAPDVVTIDQTLRVDPPAGSYMQFGITNGKVFSDDATNCVVAETQHFGIDQGLGFHNYTNGHGYAWVDITYHYSTPDQTQNLKLFLHPSNYTYGWPSSSYEIPGWYYTLID